MPEITLEARPGRVTGSAESNRLRAQGRIPAVIYGHGTEALPVSVDARELRAALSTDAGLNQLLNLRVGSSSHLTLARELQRHPVRNTLSHVDFLIVRRDEVVTADVPLILVGEAKEVERQGGLVEQPVTSIAVRATPDRIPHAIEIDITNLNVGDSVRVSDLDLPEGVVTEVDSEEAVVTTELSAAALEPEEAAAEGEGEGEAEGEETAPSSEE